MSEEFGGVTRGGLGDPLRHLVSVDSTNTVALAWASEGAPHGATVVADEQTAGRGRWGRRWISGPGASLLMSVILRRGWDDADIGLVSIAAGLGCANGLESITGVATTLKWPNDVEIDGRKVAGLLIETRVLGRRVDAIVVGIGINLNLPPDLPAEVAERATSLSHVVAEPVERRAVLAAVLGEVAEALGLEGPEVIERAGALMPQLGSRVTLVAPDGSTRDVDAVRLLPNGALEIRTDSGTEAVHAGEIARIRPL